MNAQSLYKVATVIATTLHILSPSRYILIWQDYTSLLEIGSGFKSILFGRIQSGRVDYERLGILPTGLLPEGIQQIRLMPAALKFSDIIHLGRFSAVIEADGGSTYLSGRQPGMIKR